MIRQAGESGGLYGSVSSRDISEACHRGRSGDRSLQQVVLEHPIKTLGLTKLRVVLHPEVSMDDHRQRRSQPVEEALKQARGEAVGREAEEARGAARVRPGRSARRTLNPDRARLVCGPSDRSVQLPPRDRDGFVSLKLSRARTSFSGAGRSELRVITVMVRPLHASSATRTHHIDMASFCAASRGAFLRYG